MHHLLSSIYKIAIYICLLFIAINNRFVIQDLVCCRVFTVAIVVHHSPNSCSASWGRGSLFCVSAAGHQIITDPHTSSATSAMYRPDRRSKHDVYTVATRDFYWWSIYHIQLKFGSMSLQSHAALSNPRLLSKGTPSKRRKGIFTAVYLSTSPHCNVYKNYLQIVPFLCSKGVSSLVFPFLSVLIKIVQTERQLYSRQTVWVNDRNSMLHTHIHPFSVFVGISC